MATRKQRRKREKEKRHDYDLVEIDGEGNETVLRSTELRPPSEGKRPATKGSNAPVSRRRGVVQEPSWTRVLKRGAMFSPIFFATVLLLNGNKGYSVALVNTVLLLAVFVPFSYFMDRFMWRSQQKRLAKTRDA